MTVLEEAVDLVVELLQLERSEVLLFEIQQFHSIFVHFFCRKRLEIRVWLFLPGTRQEFAFFVCRAESLSVHPDYLAQQNAPLSPTSRTVLSDTDDDRLTDKSSR